MADGPGIVEALSNDAPGRREVHDAAGASFLRSDALALQSDHILGRPRLAAALAVALLAVVCEFALGADPGAEYPLGDGGLFYAIVSQILAAHFSWLHSLSFNQVQIPFAYSPLAFYCVAAIVKLSALTIPKAMNLWVLAWGALMAPAAYFAARRFLGTRSEALVATAFLVVFTPGDLAWLGQGMGTRAPAYVFFLLGSGLIWEAFSTGSRRSAVFAGACAALAAWMHMEYASLLAVTFVVLACFRPPNLGVAALIALGAGAMISPWVVLTRDHLPAFVNALHTSRMAPFALTFGYYFGMTDPALQWWLGLWGFLCAVAACFARRYLWLAWIVVLLVVDSRAGPLAAHLPSALAMGWVFGRAWELSRPAGKGAAVVLVTALLFEAALGTARSIANEWVRLKPADAQNMALIAAHTEPNAWVISVFPGALYYAFYRDPGYDWLPPLTGRRSPIIVAALEWVDPATFTERHNDQVHVQQDCIRQGSGCLFDFAQQRLPKSDPAYVYVPAHGEAYPLVVSQLRGDKRFIPIFGNPAGTMFRLLR